MPNIVKQICFERKEKCSRGHYVAVGQSFSSLKGWYFCLWSPSKGWQDLYPQKQMFWHITGSGVFLFLSKFYFLWFFSIILKWHSQIKMVAILAIEMLERYFFFVWSVLNIPFRGKRNQLITITSFVSISKIS